MSQALDQPDHEKTVPDLRVAIARRVGVNINADSGLSKTALNSVYAYLTGEFYYPRWASHRPDSKEFAPRDKVLCKVAREAEIGTLGDEDSDSDWRKHYEDAPGDFRKSDLHDLLDELKSRGDQRDWTPD